MPTPCTLCYTCYMCYIWCALWCCSPQSCPATLAYTTGVLMHMERLARADPKWLAEYQRYTSLWDEGQYGGGSNPTFSGTSAYPGSLAAGSGSGPAPASALVGQDWADAVWESVGAGLGAMQPRDLAMLVHGMSVLGLRPAPGVLQALGSYLEERGHEMSAMQDCQVCGGEVRGVETLERGFTTSVLEGACLRQCACGASLEKCLLSTLF